jgi:C4-dicarboxylate-specific signal transduction histidine kinase
MMKWVRQNHEAHRQAKASRHRVPTRSELQQELAEVVRHRAAISEVLRVVASSPHDLQPIFDTILDSATRLCRADMGTLRLREEKSFRLVAQRLHTSTLFDRWAPPVLIEPSSFLAQQIANRSPVHIPDVAHAPVLHRDPRVVDAAKLMGIRTYLLVPMVKDEGVIGAIFLGRVQVQPFTDKEIELITDFAAQATIALDITRRERQFREIQMDLAHANRVETIGQLTASIAHELKQPLAAVAIGGNASLRWLTRRPPEIEEAKRSVECIINDVNRARDVIDRIHGLVKRKAPRMDTLDINDAIREVITLTHREAVENGVTVQTQLADHLPPIYGDRVQLQQVMLNLIINAVQAMSSLEGKRELHISTETTEEGVRIAVRDTGPGLSAETLQRLFEPFYTTKPTGMGMGLSICQSIIKEHGGRLWATGHELPGALFQFTIPANSGHR